MDLEHIQDDASTRRRDRHDAAPFSAAAPMSLAFDTEILELRVKRAGTVTKLDAAADREQLLGEVRAGTFTGKLHVDATTYIQVPGEMNRNFVRFKQSKLTKIAKSGKGSVFLRDHAQRQYEARGGTIIASEAVEYRGGIAFRQTFELAKLWAIEGILDGTLDRFSIGWIPIGDILCTACKKSIMECWHWPGDVVKAGELEFVVEFEFQDADLCETSGINVPGVVGTRIEGIRPALEAARGSGRSPRKDEVMFRTNLKVLASILSISALSDNDERAFGEVEAATKALDAKARRVEGDLSMEREATARLTKSLEVSEAKLKELVAKQLDADVAALVEEGLRAGKLLLSHDKDGKRVPDPLEEQLRAVATEFGIESAKSRLERLPAIPGSRPPTRQERGPDPTPKETGALTRAQKKLAAELGLSEEQMLKAKLELASTKGATKLDDDNEED